LYAGALFIKYAIGLEGEEGLYISILVLLAFAGFFCIAGGLQAVIYTDFVQTILMVIGVLILMALCEYFLQFSKSKLYSMELNFMIFLSHRIYVKSILGILEVQNLPF